MKNLNSLIEKICAKHAENDTNEFYQKKNGNEFYNDKKRENAIQAVLSTLMPYEKWHPQEYERVYALEYFIFYLKLSGVKECNIYPIVKKYYLQFVGSGQK
jgi:hypothetical protein